MDFYNKQIDEKFIKELNDIKKKSKFKECFYFNHENCSSKIIKAHTIQKNKVLNKISSNGMVITFNETGLELFNISKVGNNKASIFTGFCSRHDNEIFKEIELKKYENNSFQNFLFAYRAFAKETHTKKESLILMMNTIQKLEKNGFIKKIENYYFLQDSIQTALNIDAPFINNLFINGFIEKDYSKLITKVIILNYEVKFATTCAVTPIYNIMGQRIKNLNNKNKPLNMLFITIFPEDGKTYLLFSWFKYSNSIFKKWFYQLCSLSEKQRFNYLNNFIPQQTENYYINPTFWDSWDNHAKEYFKNNFKNINNGKIDYNIDCPYNLFKNSL